MRFLHTEEAMGNFPRCGSAKCLKVSTEFLPWAQLGVRSLCMRVLIIVSTVTVDLTLLYVCVSLLGLFRDILDEIKPGIYAFAGAVLLLLVAFVSISENCAF